MKYPCKVSFAKATKFGNTAKQIPNSTVLTQHKDESAQKESVSKKMDLKHAAFAVIHAFSFPY